MSSATCLVCRHLATDHAQQGLAPCMNGHELIREELPGHMQLFQRKPGGCKCPNFVLDHNSVPDGITLSELDKKCFEFFETVGFVAEELKRIADILEGGINVNSKTEG